MFKHGIHLILSLFLFFIEQVSIQLETLQNLMCEEGIKWIYNVFGDCIVSTTDKWSFGIGLLSSVFWAISAIPQVYTIYKTKNVDGISPFLFSCLFTGDLLSLIGNILNHGLVTQIITYILYVTLDTILLLQYLYFKFIKKCCSNITNGSFERVDKSLDHSLATDVSTVLIGNAVSAAVIDYSLPYQGTSLIGSIFGWCSAVICITSRVPQVILNFKRRFVSNLSPYFFACTIMGNTTYFLSLLIRDRSAQFMWKQAPWLCECLGPLTCDIITAIQMCVFGFSNANYYQKEENNSEDVGSAEENESLNSL